MLQEYTIKWSFFFFLCFLLFPKNNVNQYTNIKNNIHNHLEFACALLNHLQLYFSFEKRVLQFIIFYLIYLQKLVNKTKIDFSA
jgi:hypothetical protein